MSAIVASSRMPTPQKLQTLIRVAPPYYLVQRLRVCPPSVGSSRATTLHISKTTMVRLVNHRRVGSETSSLAAVTAHALRPAPTRGRQLAHWPAPVALQISAALRALASATARTSERSCQRRQRPFAVFLPPPARRPPRRHHHQQRTPIPHQHQLLSRQSPSQRLPKHPNNQLRRRQRPTTTPMTA